MVSSSSCTRISLNWPNVDVFTFGKESIYGYDLLNHCIIVQNVSNDSIDRIHLSSSPSWPIRRLILNEDESILALLADKIVYIVYLHQTNQSKGIFSSKNKRIY